MAVIYLLLLFSSLKYVVEASHELDLLYQSVSALKVKQEHRTAYHFQPKRNWINDPNGPMHYNGMYHLFYQYNPKGAVWGNIAWGHSVSKDLINWKELKPAIQPSKPFDKYGCWSGSTTILPSNKPVILYTGVIDENKTEVQNYAIPANLSDPYLEEWIKPNDNPLVVAGKDINASVFRDPTTTWLDRNGHWTMLLGGSRKGRGIAYLYRSKDFKKWIKAKHPLHSVAGTGNWECLDLFPVKNSKGLDYSLIGKSDLKHVFKVSLDKTRYDYYTIGTYDQKNYRYIPDKTMVDGLEGLRYDYGNFYASKSFYDPKKKRRILWGWSNESDTRMDDVRKGWAGIQAIPRKIMLHPNAKQLMLWPTEEHETLRTPEKVRINNQKLIKGQSMEVKGITAAQADVEVVFTFASLEKSEPFDPRWNQIDAQELCRQKGSFNQGGVGPFGLLTLASENLEEYTPVFFRVFKAGHKHKILMCSDASRSSLRKGMYRPSYAGFLNIPIDNKRLSLRTLIDNSVVESFAAGGMVCITSRVYPTLAVSGNAHLYVFNNGSETITIENLDAWSMRTSDVN